MMISWSSFSTQICVSSRWNQGAELHGAGLWRHPQTPFSCEGWNCVLHIFHGYQLDPAGCQWQPSSLPAAELCGLHERSTGIWNANHTGTSKYKNCTINTGVLLRATINCHYSPFVLPFSRWWLRMWIRAKMVRWPTPSSHQAWAACSRLTRWQEASPQRPSWTVRSLPRPSENRSVVE